MANEYSVNAADLTAVADAIRAKGDTTAYLAFPAEFASAIAAIESGSQVATGTISITTLGTVNFSIAPGFVVRHLVFVNQKYTMDLPNCQFGYWTNGAGYVQGSSTTSSAEAGSTTRITVTSTAASTSVSWTGCKLYPRTLFWFAVS